MKYVKKKNIFVNFNIILLVIYISSPRESHEQIIWTQPPLEDYKRWFTLKL
jgi:hypothetical protein